MFFIRQKTSNGVRIIDWSSDVCSSDLKPAIEPAFFWATRRLASPAPLPPAGEGGAQRRVRARLLILRVRAVRGSRPSALLPRAAFELQALALQIGRAHVCTPVTNAQLVSRLMLEKTKKNKLYIYTTNENIK